MSINVAWRLISYKIFEGRKLAQKNVTQFTTNPVIFGEMFVKYLKLLKEEENNIWEWDDLLNFEVDSLAQSEGIEEIFRMDCRRDGGDLVVYDIETVEILVL
jgi:hypothetical protein